MNFTEIKRIYERKKKIVCIESNKSINRYNTGMIIFQSLYIYIYIGTGAGVNEDEPCD